MFDYHNKVGGENYSRGFEGGLKHQRALSNTVQWPVWASLTEVAVAYIRTLNALEWALVTLGVEEFSDISGGDNAG